MSHRQPTSSDAPGGICKPAETSAAAIEARIFALLALRREGATICPSEVARGLAGKGGPWHQLMPQVREVAQVLAGEGRLIATRHGKRVDATAPGGPIRLALPRRSP